MFKTKKIKYVLAFCLQFSKLKINKLLQFFKTDKNNKIVKCKEKVQKVNLCSKTAIINQTIYNNLTKNIKIKNIILFLKFKIINK